MVLHQAWGTPAEVETRRRMRLLVAAFAYERMNLTLISDHEFDAECLKVDLTTDTGHPAWDAWWRKHFDPSTGMWVNQHPDLNGLERLTTSIARSKGMI